MTAKTGAASTLFPAGCQRSLQGGGVPLLSFFSGAGFLDIGFLQAGFKIVWSNEFNKSFARAYREGMASLGCEDDISVNTESIVNLGPNQIAREAFHNTPRPDLFGIIGGPPCPDFSVGGKNKGADGEQGRLSRVFVNRIIELQPTFFLFENVPGLVRTAKHRKFFETLRQELSAYYRVDYKIVNALEHGVPQDRERLFMIGFHRSWLRRNKDIPESTRNAEWFSWPAGRYQNVKKQYQWPDISPPGEEPERPRGVPEELMVGPLICDAEEIARLPNGEEYFRPKSRKFAVIPEGDVSRKSFKRLHRWRYSPTAAYGNNEVHVHPVFPRRLAVREALRIQTVPDEYVMPRDLSLTDKFKMIGNGVPVKLAHAVASAIMRYLEVK